jgi:hypothetical protein
MTSTLTHLVALEQISDQRRAAARHHLASVAANETRRMRSPRLSSLRAPRSLVGLAKRFKLA